MLLNEALTLKVIIKCKKLLKIMDKAVIYQILDCVSSKVLNNLLIKTLQKIFKISLEVRNIGQE